MKKLLLLSLVLMECLAGGAQDVVITEILYDPASTEPAGGQTQYIEIHNVSTSSVSLDGWTIDDEDADGPNTLPAITLAAGGTAVIAGSTSADFEEAWGTASGYTLISLKDLGQTMFNLGNGPTAASESIALRTSNGTLVDQVNYDDANGWPGSAGGFSIYFNLAPDNTSEAENDDGINWSTSQDGVDGAYQSTAQASGVWDAVEVGSPGVVVAPTAILPEPTNHAKDASAQSEFDAIHITWVDADPGTQAPDGYLVVVYEGTAPSAPADGTSPDTDNDLSDGIGYRYISDDEANETTFYGLSENTTYGYIIYPYTNAGTDIDYKVDGSPASGTDTTPMKIFAEDFQSVNALPEIDEYFRFVDSNTDADDQWYLGSVSADQFAEYTVNVSDGPEADAMVFGPFNLDAYDNAVLSFTTELGGDDATGTPISASYVVGNGSPVALNAEYSTGGYEEVFSGVLDLSAASGIVYITFIYNDSQGEGTAHVDDIKLSGDYVATSVAASDSGTPSTSNDLLVTSNVTSDLYIAVNDLTLDAQLTVPEGSTIVVYGNLTVNASGTLKVQDGGSVILYKEPTINGTATFERATTFSTTEGRYSVLGTPVRAATTAVLGSPVYSFDESASFGSGQFVEVTSPETMTPGDAYFSANTGTVTYSGIPNEGTISQPLLYDAADGSDAGFNLIGNPYASAINATELINQNNDITGAIYIWDDGGSENGQRPNSDYIIWNAIGGTQSTGGTGRSFDGVLRSSQGFFVQATGSGNVYFKENMQQQANNTSDAFYRQTNDADNVVRLSLTGAGLYSDMLVGLRGNATMGYDRLYDAYKTKSGKAINIYSLLDGQPYAIQGLPSKASEMTLALGLDVEDQGTYSINLEESSLTNHQVYLVDHQANEVIDLSGTGHYTFSSGGSGLSDRFELVLSPGSAVLNVPLREDIKVFGSDNLLTVEANEDHGISNIRVYDFQGKLRRVYKHVDLSSGSVNLPFEGRGMFILSLQSDAGILSKKFIF